MNEPNQSVGRLLARSAVELALVTALVFATGWGGVRLAEAVHRHPVTPGRDGTIELPIVKSDRSGNVSFEEGSGYKGWWHCQGGDWGVNWRLVAEFRHYRVLARVARSEAKTPALAISFIIGVIASAKHTRIDAKSDSTGRRDVITEHAADHALAEDMHAPPTPLWGGQSGFAFAVVNEKKVQIASVADGPRGSV